MATNDELIQSILSGISELQDRVANLDNEDLKEIDSKVWSVVEEERAL